MAAGLRWIRSSYSDPNEACVEFALDLWETVHVRDTKDRSGSQLSFTSSAWSAFVLLASSL